MINSIEIKNFKSIKNKNFNLRNLNLLFGLNGMGKSSFIQNLLVFRQSKNLIGGRLDLIGDYIEIGTTKDALYQYALKDDSFATDIKFSDMKEYNWVFDYQFEADFFELKSKKKYSSENEKIIKSILSDEPLFNNNFQYLHANRNEPSSVNTKNFTQTIKLHNIGNKGEFSAHYIETFGNEPIKIDSLLHPNSVTKDDLMDGEIVNKTLINQINLWMGEISPNINIRTTTISSDHVLLEYIYKQPNLGNTNRFKPENVGFGITFGLPVVVALLKAKPGDLLIIENPESHIHPRGQAEMGKLIAKAAMNNVQIIIETHSDHILNSIRVAVKEKDIDKEKVVAFYFEKIIETNEQYSKITNIEIDQNGELSEYPKDMLDEWSNQLLKLL